MRLIHMEFMCVWVWDREQFSMWINSVAQANISDCIAHLLSHGFVLPLGLVSRLLSVHRLCCTGLEDIPCHLHTVPITVPFCIYLLPMALWSEPWLDGYDWNLGSGDRAVGGCTRKVGACDLQRVWGTFRAQARSALGSHGSLGTARGNLSRDGGRHPPGAVSAFSKGAEGLKMVLFVHSPQTCIHVVCFFLETFLLTVF